jgi:acetyl-CoA synthetase
MTSLVFIGNKPQFWQYFSSKIARIMKMDAMNANEKIVPASDQQSEPSANPLYNDASYKRWHEASLQESFWIEQAQQLDWIQFPTKTNGSRFHSHAEISWFEDGTLNVCYNCVDRHLHSQKTAIIFEPDECGKTERISYQTLHQKVCQMANALKKLGIKKGDIVTLYLPMEPSIIYSMLACARIGAVHSVVFSGFSSHALSDRLVQSRSKVLITKRASQRGGRSISLKENVDSAIQESASVGVLPVVLLTDDVYSESSASEFSDECPCEEMSSTDPLFILYTSGSTGCPKGVVHSSGGYLTYVATTYRLIFDAKPNDVYFCTADIGWITGHSYGVYGPLVNGATLVLFQGVPTYPDASRFWKIIDEQRVSVFYTSPTALRSLRKSSQDFIEQANLSSLRILASVGEPIDPATWQWFYERVGHQNCPIMDTWWQTETGGVLICPLVQKSGQTPSCAAKPFAGIVPTIVPCKISDSIEQSGQLCFKNSWPGQFIGILNDPEYFQTYFQNGVYASGDGGRIDSDGNVWILGRLDDVINVSGHRLNSAELEQAAGSHPDISEACVVGYPHDIKGQGLCVFAVVRSGVDVNTAPQSITFQMRQIIGPIAAPDKVIILPELPKTRSGKTVRRLLRKIAEGCNVEHEDTSTLVNPEAVPLAVQRFGACVK